MKKPSMTSAELRQISDSIRDGFDLHAFRESIELVINPVDPYHIHADWNIGGYETGDQTGEHRSLVLQLFWDHAIENHCVNTTNQFHVVLDTCNGKKTLRAPVDNVYYRGVIGYIDNTFTVEQIVESNIIHLPRANMLAPVVDQPDKVRQATNRAEHKKFPETVKRSLQIPNEAELHDRILRQLGKSGFDGANVLQALAIPQSSPEECNQPVDFKTYDEDDTKILDEAVIDQLIIEAIKHGDDRHVMPVLQSVIAPASPLYSNNSGRNIKL